MSPHELLGLKRHARAKTTTKEDLAPEIEIVDPTAKPPTPTTTKDLAPEIEIVDPSGTTSESVPIDLDAIIHDLPPPVEHAAVRRFGSAGAMISFALIAFTIAIDVLIVKML